MEKNPKCPKGEDELSDLIYALTDDRFIDPVKSRKKIQAQIDELRGKKVSEDMIKLYQATYGFTTEEEEAASLMLRWGDNQRYCQQNYVFHIMQGCPDCSHAYARLIASVAVELSRDDEVDLEKEKERYEYYLRKAHDELLGKIVIGGGKVSLETLFVED